MQAELAVKGGAPVRTRAWPHWPQPAPGTLGALAQVLFSGRWAISGPYRGERSFERRFSDAFAAFSGARFCVPTASGTASLLAALEACGVGAGDEVIIPGMTWVANASTVAAVNAVPVLADIDPRTMCMDPDAVADRIGPRTAAIVVVHLYGAVADLDALTALTERHGLALIEDCAQSHGARYRDRRVGTFGDLGAFSMQHTKVLTSGEGGAVITDRPDLARAVEHLRADGRSYAEEPPPVGMLELVETAELMGSNMCLSEFQAAVLLGQLPLLEEQNAVRRRNAELLDKMLRDLGFTPQTTSEGTTERTFYQYAVSVTDDRVVRCGIHRLGGALTAELNTVVAPAYPPLNANVLYNPGSRRRFTVLSSLADRLALHGYELPVCADVATRTLTLHHSVLLGDENDMQDIAAGFTKVVRQREALLR